MNKVAVDPVLSHGLEQLGLSLSAAQTGQLMAYLDLLQKWGKVYNLTAVREPGEMLTHHLLDSLAVVPAVQRQRVEWKARQDRQVCQEGGVARPFKVLDVGSGAGLPGVVLAVTLPEIQVVCVDAVAKKTAFIQQAALALKLTNLKARHARVETLTDPFEVVTSRAFASLTDFTQWTRQALAPEGVWMAMKGKRPDDELAALDPQQTAVFHVEPLTVPGLDAERCLVWLKPKAGPQLAIT
jgi:16S rRNA (guanine527-N7)-methyltransferase